MLYEEMHRTYGSHVSQRLRRELTTSELHRTDIDYLPDWLEKRAEAAHAQYRGLQNNPLAASDTDTIGTADACRRWREAEDLAYLISVSKEAALSAVSAR